MALSEMETELSRQRARCDVVRAAEGGEEVVERVLIGQVDGGKRQTPFVLLPVEEIVVAHGHIEQIAGSDARRFVIVIFGPRRGYRY